MLKLPKGLKKKKKGKKSKRKGEDDLFTEEELEQYRREHQQQAGESAKENEEWSKFKDLTTGVDSVLKKTQGDLDRIKSTSFFQRVPAGAKELEPPPKEEPTRPVVQVTAADFPHLVAAAAAAAAAADDVSDAALTEDESEEEEGDDIFDTSYVEAVERGEVKLAYVPDSPVDCPEDDHIFDTSHVDALIKGQEAKASKGKKTLDIGIAVGVLTGRIDNVTVTTTKRSKRVIPGDLLLESEDKEGQPQPVPSVSKPEPIEASILDTDSDIPITTPIDLSVSLHTVLLQQSRRNSQEDLSVQEEPSTTNQKEEDEFDEFTQLAAESLEASAVVVRLDDKEIKLEPVLQESWSVFEADKSDTVFAECVVEDQIDVIDPYIDEDDPFDTSFADAVVPTPQLHQVKKEAVILEDDDDFDPRAEEVQLKLNNRRKSSVRIHLTDPSGLRESITSDELIDKEEEVAPSRDLLGGSTTDLTQLGDSPLDPEDINITEIDPFDTSIVDKIVLPGKVELKRLEKELISNIPVAVPIYRVPSDPDFDPRAEEEPKKSERRASRPENLVVSKSVVFNVDGEEVTNLDNKQKAPKPVTPYYTRELSITEDVNEEAAEQVDSVPETLTRTRSDENLAQKPSYQNKRRHSEYPGARPDLLQDPPADLTAAALPVLKPRVPPPRPAQPAPDPFDTSFAADIAPSKTELRLLAKEFSCEDSTPVHGPSGAPDLLEPEDDIFQAKALTPEPSDANRSLENYDPFDTSFAGDLNPGRTELKLLESEFLN